MRHTVYLNRPEPIVLIDCSYYIFHRYFATIRWFSFKNIVIDPLTIDTNEEYLVAFEDHFNKDMNKIAQKCKTPINNIYMGIDCLRADIWRNELHPNYKGTRVHTEKFNRNIFDIFKQKINTYIPMLSGNNLEADDVIAILHEKIRTETPDRSIIVISNDKDYIQLVDEKTNIFNMQFKDIKDPDHDVISHLRRKGLLGDNSDNIKKVDNMTKQKATALLNLSSEEFDEWLIKNNCKNQFDTNIKLIDFKNIPINLKTEFIKKIEFKKGCENEDRNYKKNNKKHVVSKKQINNKNKSFGKECGSNSIYELDTITSDFQKILTI